MDSTSNVADNPLLSRKSIQPSVVMRPGSSYARVRRVLRPKVAVRLIGICFFGCLTGYLFFDSPYWMAGIWTAFGTAVLFYETVRFVEQSERKLTSFLQALNQNDFSVTFNENRKSDDYDLHHAFNQLNETYKSLRSDKESQHQLLQVIVETAAAPMICYEEGSEQVYIVNEAAKKLFGIPFLRHIRSLWRADAMLPVLIRNIQDGEKETFKLVSTGRPIILSVTSSHILFKSKNLKLIAFNDVSSELGMKEAETWQRLLRVLTHEISNSAIPLSTLSSFIYEMVSKSEGRLNELSEEDRHDILTSLKTIEQRSRSLKEFVQNFRSINQVPEPVIQQMSVKTILDEVYALFHKEAIKENIIITIEELPDLYTIHADRNLTMQVLINVMKNAMEAMSNMKNEKRIRIRALKTGRYINLDIADTGCGISKEDMDQIFIPFYTTKERGSGIGLSISRQIMQRQKGDITVTSIQGKGTQFTVSFLS